MDEPVAHINPGPMDPVAFRLNLVAVSARCINNSKPLLPTTTLVAHRLSTEAMGNHRSDWLKEKQAYLERTENPTRVTDANWGLTYISPVDCVENGETVLQEAQGWFSFFTSEPFKKQSCFMDVSPENEPTCAKKS